MDQIAATIQGQTFHYEGPLTMKQIYTFHDAVRASLHDPEYLFLTKRGEATLNDEWKMNCTQTRTCIDTKLRTLQGMHVIELATVLDMHVIVLPTLAENTLMIGKLVFHATPQPEPPDPQPQRQMSRKKIEDIAEQAIQHMKEKGIELDWNEA
jgi:hypothetical protein